MSDIQKMTHSYLTSRDGCVKRDGKAMTRLAKRTGYSVEALRSFAYGRRDPRPDDRLKVLRKAVRGG